MANIQQKRVFSSVLNRMVSLKMATSTIRTMENNGGFDAYILRQPDKVLSKRALTVKNRIRNRLTRQSKGAQA